MLPRAPLRQGQARAVLALLCAGALLVLLLLLTGPRGPSFGSLAVGFLTQWIGSNSTDGEVRVFQLEHCPCVRTLHITNYR